MQTHTVACKTMCNLICSIIHSLPPQPPVQSVAPGSAQSSGPFWGLCAAPQPGAAGRAAGDARGAARIVSAQRVGQRN